MIALSAARVATPHGARANWWVTVEDGLIAAVEPEPLPGAVRMHLGAVDLIPGIVDLHSDCLEERARLRPTNRQPIEAALLQLDAEAAAHGITTQFICASFEDDPVGHRSTESAAEIVDAVAAWCEHLRVDTRVHLRYELTSERMALVRELAALDPVGIVSYMDHSPGQGQFVTEAAWREWYARRFRGDERALDELIARRRARQAGVGERRSELAALARACAAKLASHDDDIVADVERSVELGSSIAEFPVSTAAAAAAAAAGLGVVMGAPNAQRGRSHMDGLSARSALAAGHLDALASDYHPASLIGAVYQLAADRVCAWTDAVALVSDGPARIAGLDDRGRIEPGLRADLAAIGVIGGRPIVRQLWVEGRAVFGGAGAPPSRAGRAQAAEPEPEPGVRAGDTPVPVSDRTRIRPATWSDRVAIAALIDAIGGHDGAAHRAGTDVAIAAVLELATARLLVAEDEREVVVGHLELHSRPGTLHGEQEGWISALSVQPDARGAGVGAQLLDAAHREAALLGCGELVLESSSGRSEAHRFYRGHGFKDAPPAVRMRAPVARSMNASLEQRFLVAAARAATAVQAALPLRAERMPDVGGFDAEDKYVDLEAERIALMFLEPLGIPIISEESGVIGARPQPGETWISLDPLDGTRNCMHGMAPWALSAGLVRAGLPVAGFVVDLSSGRRWWASTAGGARVDGRPLRPRSGGMLTLPSSPPAELAPVRGSDGFDRVRLVGSTAVDLCRVADGTAGAFCDLTRAVARVHDLAGAMAVMRAAGATVLTADGALPVLAADPSLRFHIVAAATEREARALLEGMAGASIGSGMRV